MKLLLIACLAATAIAAPQFGGHFFPHRFHHNRFPALPLPESRFDYYRPDYRPDYRHIAILRDERENFGDGNFHYNFETENGIRVNAVGTPGSRGQSNIRGSYSYPLPGGGVAEVRYVADEDGYRAESPLIPTPHPLPAHAVEQIRKAESERRRGFNF